MVKILYVLDFFYPHVGGVITLFYNLAIEMKKKGNAVTVLTTHYSNTKSFEKIDGIKVYRVGKSRESFMTQATSKLLSMKEKFDIVHTSTYSAMIPSYIYSVLRRVPRVLTAHEIWSLGEYLEFYGAKGVFYFLAERILFSLSFDCYTSPSEHTKNDLKKIGISAEKIKVIPHGIDSKFFNPRMKKFRKEFRKRYMLEDQIIATFIGKATVFKGIDYLIEAIQKVLQKKEMKFIFLLSKLHLSSYKNFIKKISRNEILRKHIILAEPKPDNEYVAKLIAASDFVVMPSLSEGFGLVAAESASIGIPVIVTKGTSLEEVIENNKNGLFVKLRNVNDLTNAILKLANNERLRKKLSKPKKFHDWGLVVKRYDEVYEDIIRKNKKEK